MLSELAGSRQTTTCFAPRRRISAAAALICGRHGGFFFASLLRISVLEKQTTSQYFRISSLLCFSPTSDECGDISRHATMLSPCASCIAAGVAQGSERVAGLVHAITAVLSHNSVVSLLHVSAIELTKQLLSECTLGS